MKLIYPALLGTILGLAWLAFILSSRPARECKVVSWTSRGPVESVVYTGLRNDDSKLMATVMVDKRSYLIAEQAPISLIKTGAHAWSATYENGTKALLVDIGDKKCAVFLME